jgi:hypothetical protein
MNSIPKTKHAFFITDGKFNLPKENENLVIQKFYDISKNKIYSFICQNDDLYIMINQNTFGSAFFGNTVLKNPKYYIIKKFNPILLIIQIIYSDEKKEENKGNNNIYDYVDTNAIIQKYEDKLKILKNSELFNNMNFDSIYKSTINLIKNIFEKYSKYIELIAEVKEIDAIEKKICAKKCESKIFNYLNSKVNNLNDDEMKEIENLKPNNEDEKKELMDRASYEKFSILEPFIPNEINSKYKTYRFKDYIEEDEISKASNNSVKSGKRKNVGEKSNKKRHAKKAPKERSKGQFSMDSFLKKKQ